VASAGDGPDPAVRGALFRPFLPRKVVLHRHGSSGGLEEVAPYTANLEPLGGETTLFVCRDFTCGMPSTDVEQALAALRDSVAAETPSPTESGND
jgi:uncharacterized protein YyaL (SSP411 family)